MRTGEDLGLGWFVTPTAFGHRGCLGTNGFHSYFFGFHGEASPDLRSASLAIMTDSFEGLGAIRALVKAIMFLKLWPRQLIMPSNLGIDGSLPCLTVVGTEWKTWLGSGQSLPKADVSRQMSSVTSEFIELMVFYRVFDRSRRPADAEVPQH